MIRYAIYCILCFLYFYILLAPSKKDKIIKKYTDFFVTKRSSFEYIAQNLPLTFEEGRINQSRPDYTDIAIIDTTFVPYIGDIEGLIHIHRGLSNNSNIDFFMKREFYDDVAYDILYIYSPLEEYNGGIMLDTCWYLKVHTEPGKFFSM